MRARLTFHPPSLNLDGSTQGVSNRLARCPDCGLDSKASDDIPTYGYYVIPARGYIIDGIMPDWRTGRMAWYDICLFS
jgi:hypothetical protein